MIKFLFYIKQIFLLFYNIQLSFKLKIHSNIFEFLRFCKYNIEPDFEEISDERFLYFKY